MKIIDISPEVKIGSPVWPGDTEFSYKWVMEMEKGMSCNVSTITTSVHIGAHTDAPFHFEPNGQTIDEVPLEKYIGKTLVVEVNAKEKVKPEDFSHVSLEGVQRVLFKTRKAPPIENFETNYVAVANETAEFLAKNGIILVGIDTYSMDDFHSKDLKTHHILLQNGIAILEGIDLSKVEEGIYELIALPLKLKGLDASPVRAILRTFD